MKTAEARSPSWRILAASCRENWIALDVLLAMDGVLLLSDIRKESRMIRFPVVVFEFYLFSSPPCCTLFLAAIAALYLTMSVSRLVCWSVRNEFQSYNAQYRIQEIDTNAYTTNV